MLPEEVYVGSSGSSRSSLKYAHPLSHMEFDDDMVRARLAYDLMSFMDRSDCPYFINSNKVSGYNPSESHDEIDIMIVDGYYTEAERLADERLLEDKECDKTLFQKAFIQHLKAEYQRLLDHEEDVLKSDPKNINALINKGFALVNLNRKEDALKVADKALKIDPENLTVLSHKAYLAKEMNKDSLYDKTLLQAYNVSAKQRMESLAISESSLLSDMNSIFMGVEPDSVFLSAFNKSSAMGSVSYH